MKARLNGSDVKRRRRSANGQSIYEMETIQNFVAYFKAMRTSMNMTQAQVGQAITQHFNKSVSQTVISRFESMNLSAKNMSNLVPLLHIWLEDSNPEFPILYFIPTEDVDSVRHKSFKLRKTPTTINDYQRNVLAEFFQTNRSPDNDQMADLAEHLGLGFSTVKIWFVNHRATSSKNGGIIYRTPGPSAYNLDEDDHFIQPSQETMLDRKHFTQFYTEPTFLIYTEPIFLFYTVEPTYETPTSSVDPTTPIKAEFNEEFSFK